MKYTPFNNRIIVKLVKSDFKKTKGGIIVDAESQKTATKNNLIEATIVKCGDKCKVFTDEQSGLVVLIHETGGTPMSGVDEDYRVIREDDIWAWSEEPLEEGITLASVHAESGMSKLIEKGANS